MGAFAALYNLIICASGGQVPCEYQLASYKSLTRQECVERMAIIRLGQPHLRVVCINKKQSDVIDSAGELRPTYEADPLDGQPLRR